MIKRKTSKFNVNISKQGIKERTYNGILFDSIVEMKYYRDYLLNEEKSGNISNIKIHPKYILQDKFEKDGKNILPIYYEVDFEYVDSEGKIIVVDIKGMELADAKLKKKIFDYKYPDIILKWISYSKIDGGWINSDDLKIARNKRKKEKLNKLNKLKN